MAQCLHTLNRDDEAQRLLKEALSRIESLPVFQQLAGLQMDLEQYAEALETIAAATSFSPIIDSRNRQWLAAQGCRAASALGNNSQVAAFARQLEDEYHRALSGRLEGQSKPFRRIQLSIPFIQQYRLTCVPATLTMLCRFWGLVTEQVEVAEAICYDGTPSHRARRWAEEQGLIAREFTVDWKVATALLDRRIPFGVYITEPTSAHVQVVVGYDELRRTFILRNPAFPQIQEAFADQFLKHYAATGPAGLVLIPASRQEELNGLSFPDAELYSGLRNVQQALEEHRRGHAEEQFARLQKAAPDHWLTLTAGRALYAYDTNTPALLDCLNKLLAHFPEDGNLLLAKFGILREIGRREERLEFLRDICERKTADPIFRQQLAQELLADARQHPQAELALKRAVRAQPLNGHIITARADLYWHQRRFDESLDLYRFVACLEETKAPPSIAYFRAAAARGQTESALTFLQNRRNRNSTKSPEPFITWFNAQLQIGRTKQALNHLEQGLHDFPAQGELWLTGADAFARHGDLQRADECLKAAQGKVQQAALLRHKADLARYRTDSKTALALWQEVLQLEPLSVPVHRSVVWVLAETEGREAALKHLEEICGRFPHHYLLHQLWAEWARGAGPQIGEKVARKLVEDHAADAWSRRQLALVLADAARFEEALAEAEEGVRLAPLDPASLGTRALIKLHLGRTTEGQDDYRQAVRLAVDYSPAVYGLVNSYHTVAERRDALSFVESELVRQVVLGEGLRAYRDAARLNLEPEALLASLQVALRERPDLAVASSIVVQQLAEMLRLDEALVLAKDATERFPLQEQAWIDLAVVQRLRLEAKGEQLALEQAMRVSPASSSAARMLGHYYERHGDVLRAKELLEEACTRAPLDAASHGALAAVLWRQGHKTAAIDRMRHALKVQPAYTWGWQTLAGWSTANGQPQLAEELAKILVLQRPGEMRSMLVLARLLAGTKRLQEALGQVTRITKQFERETEPHELRAELLAALGQWAEADAACEPEVFGKQIPAGLRACRARLDAQRGNLVSAIERMQAVLRENPGYAVGWQNLADWLWHRKQHEEALAAITNLRRLDPLSPVPLGYRASMKLQKEDRAGAKADLETALKYDPGYAFASLNLFELQLADADVAGARRTFDLIQRYIGGEKAKTCEIKLRTKSLQVSAKQVAAPAAKELRANELDQAFNHFKALCAAKESNREDFDAAITALVNAGERKRVEQILQQTVLVPNCNPAVGDWWMRRRIAQGKWFSTHKVNCLCPTSAAARQAVLRLIESLGQKKQPIGRTIAIAYLIIVLERFVERQCRTAALLWLAWRHRRWLPTDTNGWASMGYALVSLRHFTAANYWMRDWRNRPGLRMWMLLNLALSLRERWRWQRAREVLALAVTLPEHDDTFQKLRLLLAMELAMAGDTQHATEHFRELDSTGWSIYMLIQRRLCRGLLAVQTAPSEKVRVFRSERRDIHKLLAKHGLSRIRMDYWRSICRMARDTGSKWIVFLTWVGF
jgi:tetratricopeptide (TPR) repeat protein